MGLGFLSSGKYIILNNGAYFHNFDIVPPWQTPMANGNVQIFTNPGPARGWFTRSVLSYDKWLPSTLLLTYYQTDGSRNSQLINLASLILGQNGVWGNIAENSAGDVQFIRGILEKYKQVRDDVTLSDPVREGEPGNSSEVVEKINAINGKGEVGNVQQRRAYPLYYPASGRPADLGYGRGEGASGQSRAGGDRCGF